ncbi:carboxypeptidase regulatory-like domain-containing protein [Dactylosporangium sp. CA-233914]|uniref:carboxypeptidase regulatory-like domain-containing protein n=1 Tax=Dactylosporangium sp. CA-233914 TaxID=3239934 RepID=UPI003D8FBAF2
MHRPLLRTLSILCLVAAATAIPKPAAAAGANLISVDASAPTGVIQPGVTGQMMEWASDEMNGAWAERVADRSFEREQVTSARSTLYDGFNGSTLDASRWTPMSLDGAPAGTVAVTGGNAVITGSAPGRYGIMSNPIPQSRYATVSVETKIVSYTGTNAILSVYGGTGAGDFSHFAEFAIEGGVLKVFADGQPVWTGGAASTPATLRVDVSGLAGTARTLGFYYNGTLVYTLSGFTGLPGTYRAFLYGWSGTVTADYLTMTPDATYDAFEGTALSPRWTPTRLEGATNGTVAVGGGNLTVTGAANSRYGALSDYIRNSSTDWTTIDARLTGVSGTNGLLNIYGGTGAGDFSKFVEFGVEGGVARVFTSDGTGNFTGGAVALPATLTVQISPYWSNGRLFRFFVNGTKVHELATRFDVPAPDFRMFLYGYGTSTTTWDSVNVRQVHMLDRWDNHFEGGPGISAAWTNSTLAGGWGTSSMSNSEMVINGAANSRYGIMSQPVSESDVYDYTVEAKLDSYTGTNGLLNIYGGTGRGDFSKYVEFGVEGGTLRVYGDGVTPWTGPAISLPVVLRIEVGRWTGGGRTVNFFANDRLVYSLAATTAVPNGDYSAFLYGWGTSVTKWDYLTWWRTDGWAEDGYADQAVYSQDRTGYNGTYAQRIDIAQHTTGRKGLRQGSIAVTAGRAYQVSAYLKQTALSSPVTVTLGPDVGDSASYPAYASTTFSGIGSGWSKFTATLTPTTTDPYAKLFLGTAGTGTLWIDMVSVMPLDPAEVTLGGWRKDFVDALTALKPGAIRWPGGIIADSYTFTDGIGPRDNRPPMHYNQWDALWLSNDVGTDEVLALASALSIPVYLNVNWGRGTPATAANWVEYTNGSTATTYGAQRAANGRSQPWNVRTWEIGNEVWGSWTPGWTSAANYAASYNTFRDAMAAKDSTIAFIGEGGDGTNNDQTWNTTVLSTSASRMDHLSVHYYSPQPLPANYDNLTVYQASVGAPAVIGDRMATATNTILASGGGRDIKLAVTEQNAMYFNEEHRRTRTLEGGLQEAGLLNLFMRRADVNEINGASALVNFWDGSAIRLANRGSFVTPGYLVQKLAATQRGPLLLDTTVAGPTYTAPALGNLPARSGVPMLDVTTTRSADGTKLYLSVVNRDPAAVQTSTINLTGAGTIGSTASVATVNSPGYLDQNSWQNPGLIQTATSTITGVGANFDYTFPAHSYTVITVTIGASPVSAPTIIGRVTTTSGTPIPGATVDAGGGRTGTTDAAGYYRITAPVGTYTLTASKAGYTTKVRTAVEVSTLGATPLPFRLS